MANLLSSLEDGGEDDDKTIEKHSTEREREREMAFSTVGAGST